MLAFAAVLLLLASSPAAAGVPEPPGAGAQELLAGALKTARRWRADACLAGIQIDVGELCDSVRDRPVRFNRLRYYFYSRSAGRRWRVEVLDALDADDCGGRPSGLFDGGKPSRYDEFEASCITQMPLDSRGAIGVAALSGLPPVWSERVVHPLTLYLRRAADENSVYWKLPALRGRTFWDVVDAARKDDDRRKLRNVVIDAKDGKVLLKDGRLELDEP